MFLFSTAEMNSDQKKLANYLTLVEIGTINSLEGFSRGVLVGRAFKEEFMRLAMNR